MKLLAVGDCHGDTGWAEKVNAHAAERGVDAVLYLGDFGYLYTDEFLDVHAASPVPVWFLRGNHDDTIWLRERNGGHLHGTGRVQVGDNLWFLPDGARIDGPRRSAVCLGGATSIDRYRRTEGVSWWRDETVRPVAVESAIESGCEVVFAHDAPRVPLGLKSDRDSSAHRKIMREVADRLRPQVWVHGHYHLSHRTLFNDVTVAGLDMNGSPFDVSTLVVDL